MTQQVTELRKKIKSLASAEISDTMQWFFKTGKGEYGEGDRFAGLNVPTQRKISKQFKDLKLSELKILLCSRVHEERLIALLILVNKYENGNDKQRDQILSFYLQNRKGINNWDLVDLSAPKIVGKHLLKKDKSLLNKLAQSKNLWDRRIAILSTYAFIRNNDFESTMKIAYILINDKHDLIHKAVGWMLREVGNKNLRSEETFLKKYYRRMPRTMLRYAIEKFPESKRKKYLQGKI
ncbi:MAG: hypothetical protein DAHOPDDO_03206 [Ignavibacteriaceae bacterium]|nr:hypothetical protein [Ignavibacteriaceae bacterium]